MPTELMRIAIAGARFSKPNSCSLVHSTRTGRPGRASASTAASAAASSAPAEP